VDSDGWDEGVIMSFMNDSKTQGIHISLPNDRSIILFTQDEATIPDIAQNVAGILSWLGAPKGFRVYLWWRDDPRLLGVQEFPSRRTVNGGWAYPNSTEVFVYRSEEYDRVVIHECVHALGWDWEMPTTPLPCWNLGPNASVTPHLFEAWTELLAEWLYCAWHEIEWEIQRKHQDYQAVQILARNTHKDWDENTNVFAYYVLKAALAPHVQFVWVHGNGVTQDERNHILCTLSSPELEKLRTRASTTEPEALSLCMTVRVHL